MSGSALAVLKNNARLGVSGEEVTESRMLMFLWVVTSIPSPLNVAAGHYDQVRKAQKPTRRNHFWGSRGKISTGCAEPDEQETPALQFMISSGAPPRPADRETRFHEEKSRCTTNSPHQNRRFSSDCQRSYRTQNYGRRHSDEERTRDAFAGMVHEITCRRGALTPRAVASFGKRREGTLPKKPRSLLRAANTQSRTTRGVFAALRTTNRF